MSKELATTAGTEVSTDVAQDAFGQTGGIEDIIIPKIMVMQKMSKLLEDRDELKVGDFIESLGDEKVGSITEPLEFIPFSMEKLWFRSKQIGNKWEFENVEAFNHSNSKRRYNETVDGETYKNELHMKFYCILPSDPSIPYAITFKGMSQKVGKALYTQMYVKNKMAGLSAAGSVMSLAGSKQENDHGSFIVFTASVGRKAEAEEVQTALMWYKTIQAGEASTNSDAPESVAKRETQAEAQSQF